MTDARSVAAQQQALEGIRIVWLSAPGPIPLAAMLLSDFGADVIRIDRPDGAPEVSGLGSADDPRTRGQRTIGIDLKNPRGCDVARRLLASADVFIEGMRPGAAERLALGPDDLRGLNPKLIYARMTGWGQSGANASLAGHDINYIAAAGALHPIGPASEPPAVPLNLVGDFGGGSMYLVAAILAALIQRSTTERGQVIDCAMVDGAASLTTLFHGMMAAGIWSQNREDNLFDGAAPFYRTYRTADDRFVAVGALEPKFYAALIGRAGFGIHRLASARQITLAGPTSAVRRRVRQPRPRPLGVRLRQHRRLRDAGAQSARGGHIGLPARSWHVRLLGRCHPTGPGTPVERFPRDPAAPRAALRAHRHGPHPTRIRRARDSGPPCTARGGVAAPELSAHVTHEEGFVSDDETR